MSKNVELKESTLNQITQYLMDTLNRARIIPSGKELACACPFCGDSKSDPFATSFYINIDPNSDKFMNYHCFRANCMVSGVANEEFLDNIGFNNRDSIKDLNSFFASRGTVIGGKYRSKKSKTLVNVINSLSPLADKKLSYLNNRLGLNLTYEDIYNLKINLDLMELLKINEIKMTPDKEYYYQNLSDYGITFLSAYNDYVIIRDVSKSNRLKKRYTNVNIFENYDNVTKAYCIPTDIDLLDPDPCIINISEGVFDILSVKYNMKHNSKYKNQLYLAACGSGIVKTLMLYIQQYGLLNCKIHIYSDSDVALEKYSNLNILKPYLKSPDITIHYNDMSGEKDFGVPKNKIKEIKTKI